MPRHNKTSDVMRHRHRFVCWLPARDDSGLWLRVTWLCWTWDHLPAKVGKQVVGMLDDMRDTIEGRARRAGL